MSYIQPYYKKDDEKRVPDIRALIKKGNDAYDKETTHNIRLLRVSTATSILGLTQK
jgi:hypothetical protein